MPADPIRLAISDLLSADADLKALVGTRVYFQVAPTSAVYPLVTFHRQSGRPARTMGGPQTNSDLWLCKGITEGTTSASKVEEIAAAIDAALDNADLSGALSILREDDVEYPEVDGKKLYRHRGALYRVYTA